MQSLYIVIIIAPPRSPTGYHSASAGSDYKWAFQPIMQQWSILGDMVSRYAIKVHIIYSCRRLDGLNGFRPLAVSREYLYDRMQNAGDLEVTILLQNLAITSPVLTRSPL